jgi:hypothetical protein
MAGFGLIIPIAIGMYCLVRLLRDFRRKKRVLCMIDFAVLALMIAWIIGVTRSMDGSY